MMMEQILPAAYISLKTGCSSLLSRLTFTRMGRHGDVVWNVRLPDESIVMTAQSHQS
jgi:hypothetical protein